MNLLRKTHFGQFSRSFSLNMPNIRLKRSKKWTQSGFPSLRSPKSDSLLGLLITLLLFTNMAYSEPVELNGQQLFEARCSICHQLPDPSMLNYRQWHRVINTMQIRMQQADIEPLNEDEIAAIKKYLQWYADDE